MHCTCQLEVNHTTCFRLVDEMLQCSRKNSDRSLRIAAGNVFPFEPRLLQSFGRLEHDKNIQWIEHSLVVMILPQLPRDANSTLTSFINRLLTSCLLWWTNLYLQVFFTKLSWQNITIEILKILSLVGKPWLPRNWTYINFIVVLCYVSLHWHRRAFNFISLTGGVQLKF